MVLQSMDSSSSSCSSSTSSSGSSTSSSCSNADLKKIQLVNDGFDEGQRTLLPVAIASLKRSTQLEHLVVRLSEVNTVDESYVSDVWVELSDLLTHSKSLISLDVRGDVSTAWPDEAVVTILDALEHNRRLVRLDLSGHHCTLDAGLSLTRALEFSGLKEFSRQLHKQAGCERS